MSRSPTDRTSDSESLVDAFGRFMPVFKRWLELKYEKGTMSYARLKLVGMLHVKGPMIMSELGARLDVSAATLPSWSMRSSMRGWSGELLIARTARRR